MYGNALLGGVLGLTDFASSRVRVWHCVNAGP